MFGKFLVASMTLCLLFLVSSPVIAVSPAVVFEQVYDRGVEDIGYYATPTRDGGYIITGCTRDTSGSANKVDILIIKTNCYGDTLWTRTYYAYDGTYDDYGYCVQPTREGGCIIAGKILHAPIWVPGWSRGYLIKVSPTGDIVWEHIFPDSEMVACQSIQEIKNGGYGYIVTGQAKQRKGDISVIRTDAEGNPLWVCYFDNAQLSDWGYWVEETSDGNFIVAGTTASSLVGFNYDYDVCLVKISASGSILWSRTYGETGKDDGGRFVQQTSDGGYGIVGSTEVAVDDEDICFIKTDGDGNVIWHRNYGGPEHEQGYGFRQLSDGYLIVGWTASFSSTGQDLYALRTDSLGNFIWDRVFDGKGDYALGYSITKADSGCYVITGRTTNPATCGVDVYFIKMKIEDLTGAPDEEFPYSPQTFALSQNYPNPFNSQTAISFDITKTGEVNLEIFNALGQKVRTLVNQWMFPGSYTVNWDARDEKGISVASGVYFCKIQTGKFSQTKEMLLLK